MYTQYTAAGSVSQRGSKLITEEVSNCAQPLFLLLFSLLSFLRLSLRSLVPLAHTRLAVVRVVPRLYVVLEALDNTDSVLSFWSLDLDASPDPKKPLLVAFVLHLHDPPGSFNWSSQE